MTAQYDPLRPSGRLEFQCQEAQAFIADAQALERARVRGDKSKAAMLRVSLVGRANHMKPYCKDLVA